MPGLTASLVGLYEKIGWKRWCIIEQVKSKCLRYFVIDFLNFFMSMVINEIGNV
jgi:hypothetical protein